MIRLTPALTVLLAATLGAQESQPQQPVIVYHNGQPMMLMPVSTAAPAQATPAVMHTLAGQVVPPRLHDHSNPYGHPGHFVGTGITGTRTQRPSRPTATFSRLLSSHAAGRTIPGSAFEASVDSPIDGCGFLVAERGGKVVLRRTSTPPAGVPGVQLALVPLPPGATGSQAAEILD